MPKITFLARVRKWALPILQPELGRVALQLEREDGHVGVDVVVVRVRELAARPSTLFPFSS
jgi:hypothetical protein